MLFAKEQRIGAAILCGIALVAWLVVAIWPARNEESPLPEPSPVSPKKSWEERKDSIRIADSLRYAQWAAEREQRYDSFRMADSLRRAEWKKERLKWRDSARVADSLWLDSVGIPYFTSRVKKDTILDLNHCDTSELMLIRGIGHYTAAQIIRYRGHLGGYYAPSQLTDELFEKLSLDTLLYHFTADTTAIRKLRINSCSAEHLARHPYLRYKQAKAIYDLRRKRIKISSLEELRSLPQLTDDDLRRLAPYISFE